jgi:arylsulfatase A
VPFVASWPGRIKPGTVSAQTVCLNDLIATCADILGEKLPDNAGEDSVSILPALLGTATGPLRETIVHQPISRQLAIRRGQWKLIIGPKGKHELYDLVSDLGETENLAAANPGIVAELTALMKSQLAEGRSTPGASQPPEPGVKWPVP